MSDKMDCSDCIHKMVKDDGGGRWDIWCGKVAGQLDEDFDDSIGENCEYFVYDKGMLH